MLMMFGFEVELKHNKLWFLLLALAGVGHRVQVVQHCHNMNVIHRDLKPENFLLTNRSDGALLKATDFGLSVFFQDGQTFKDIVGSAYYVAPEVSICCCGWVRHGAIATAPADCCL